MEIVSTKVETTGNLSGTEDVLMGLDEAASAFVLGNLIKQYSNPYKAAMQEYLSNALDSHRISGQTRPVELTLPSDISPQLIIEDFGRGLSREEIKLFGQFGNSTKRNTNDQIGGFGLGSKSGLAIASQFTVTAVRDEKRNTIIVMRREDGHPIMKFLDEQKAPGVHNGVRVMIPTNERNQFRNALDNNFLLGWEPGSITVNGVPSTDHINVFDTERFSEIDDLGWFIDSKKNPNYYSSTNYITALIDAVRYNIDVSHLNVGHTIMERCLRYVVLKVENGKVEIHPSRESLIYDKRTKEYLQERIDAILTLQLAKFQERMEAATSYREAFQVRFDAEKFGLSSDGLLYNGEEPKIQPTDAMKTTRVTYCGSGNYASKSSDSFVSTMRVVQDSANRSPKSVFISLVTEATETYQKNSVYSYNRDTLHSMSRGVKSWADLLYREHQPKEGGTIHSGGFYTVYTSLTKAEIDPWSLSLFDMVVSAEEATELLRVDRLARARATREANKDLPKVPRSALRVTMLGAYDPFTGNYPRTASPVEEIDPEGKYVLLHKDSGVFAASVIRTLLNRNPDLSGARDHVNYIQSLGYTILYATPTARVEKYSELVPNYSGTFDDVIREEIMGVFNSLTPNRVGVIASKHLGQVDARWVDYISIKHIDEIDRVETREFVRSYGEKLTAGEKILIMLINSRESLVGPGYKDLITPQGVAKSLGRYPLLRHYYSGGNGISMDIVDYINMSDRAGLVVEQ